MSDKLKIVQTRANSNYQIDNVDHFSASIGYPNLDETPNRELIRISETADSAADSRDTQVRAAN